MPRLRPLTLLKATSPLRRSTTSSRPRHPAWRVPSSSSVASARTWARTKQISTNIWLSFTFKTNYWENCLAPHPSNVRSSSVHLKAMASGSCWSTMEPSTKLFSLTYTGKWLAGKFNFNFFVVEIHILMSTFRIKFHLIRLEYSFIIGMQYFLFCFILNKDIFNFFWQILQSNIFHFDRLSYDDFKNDKQTFQILALRPSSTTTTTTTTTRWWATSAWACQIQSSSGTSLPEASGTSGPGLNFIYN